MRISDWSSDVGSSDLPIEVLRNNRFQIVEKPGIVDRGGPHERRLLVTLVVEHLPDILARDVLEAGGAMVFEFVSDCVRLRGVGRSEEHTSELQSLMRISYAVFCLKKKKETKQRLM